MIKRTYITFFFFTIYTLLGGQDPITFLKDNLYGVQDAYQKVIIEPRYAEVKIHSNYGIIACRQNNAWNFFNFDGMLLVKSDFSKYRIESLHGTYVGTEYLTLSHLVEIRQKFDGPRYVLNPHTPDIKPNYFQPKTTIKFERSWLHDLSAAEIGIATITLENNNVNFIDSSGNLLSPIWFPRAYLVAKNYIAIDTGVGLMALYTNDLTQRSGFQYNKIVGSYNPDYFLADRKSSQGARIYLLLDTLGRIVFESEQPIKSIDQEYVIVNNEKSGLYTYERIPIAEFENSYLDYLGAAKDKFKLVQNKKTGIINREGIIILEPAYDHIGITEGKYFIGINNEGCSILDEKFHELFFLDSVQIPVADQIPGFFKGLKRVKNRTLTGLVDSLGKTVLPFEHQDIYYDKSYKFIIAMKDSVTAVYDAKLNLLLPYKIGNFVGKPGLPEFYFITPDSVWAYKLTGELFMRFANGEPLIKASNYFEYLPGVFGKNGEVLFMNEYRQLFSNGIVGTSKFVIIARAKDPSDRFNHVFNDQRKWLLPEGYALLEGYTNIHTGIQGMIIVHHMEDVLQKIEIPRAGVIDMEGRWVLPPKYQRIRVNDNDEIEVLDPITNQTRTILLPK